MKEKYPYLINIFWSEEDQLYMVEVPELEGCITFAKTIEEAAKNAQSAISSWILTAKKMKHHIPKPAVTRKVSGKFNVRLPKSLHKSLIIKAVREGVSLNHLIATSLAHAI